MTTLWPGTGGPVIDYISSPPKDLETPRRLAVLGSTGSIGGNVLDIARQKRESLKIVALAGGRNMREMPKEAEEFSPVHIAMQSDEVARDLAARLSYAPHISHGEKAYAQMAALPDVDMVVSAQSGGAGLCATISASLAGKTICLANKESLVLAGPLLREICKKTGASILPIDSEHNAIFQCLAGRGQEIEKLIITASGGPFYKKSREQLANARLEDALKHPTWKMGPKITVDSSTLMNKTLELIEAVQLFGIDPDRIEILVHPQSVVHSMVKLPDGAILAQLGVPDMRLPIAFCLTWPKQEAHDIGHLDLAKVGQLEFAKPDEELFPALSIGRQALKNPPNSPACVILNSANEICVRLFLDGQIAWRDITKLVHKALDDLGDEQLEASVLPNKIPTSHEEIAELALEMTRPIMRLDHKVRQYVLKTVAEKKLG